MGNRGRSHKKGNTRFLEDWLVTCKAVCNAPLPSLYRQECDISGGILREGAATANSAKENSVRQHRGRKRLPCSYYFSIPPTRLGCTYSSSCNTGFGSNKLFLPSKIVAGQILTEVLLILSDILFATFSNYARSIDTRTYTRAHVL